MSWSLSVSSEGRVEMLGGGSIQISNLTEEDAGIYTCMADNGNATIEAQAQLIIQGNFNLHIVCFLLWDQRHKIRTLPEAQIKKYSFAI